MLTEKQIIRALRRLEKNWPNNFWLFAGDGTLHLMKTDSGGCHVHQEDSSVDQKYIVTDFPGIDCDGGGW